MPTRHDLSLSKVPEVTLGFWIIKIAATTLGETGGDAVSMSLNLGYLVGTAIFAAIFVVAVTAQIARQDVPPVPLLGGDRRDHDGRHDAGRFRRPLARHRLHRRLDDAARAAARHRSRSGIGRSASVSVRHDQLRPRPRRSTG